MANCDAKGCFRQAEYLRVIELPDGRELKFNLCEECNKIVWKVDNRLSYLQRMALLEGKA